MALLAMMRSLHCAVPSNLGTYLQHRVADDESDGDMDGDCTARSAALYSRERCSPRQLLASTQQTDALECLDIESGRPCST